MKNAGENFSSSFHKIGLMSVYNFSKSSTLLVLEHSCWKKSHNSIIASAICFGNPPLRTTTGSNCYISTW